MDNRNIRKANLGDVAQLVELRKEQLIDEGCYAENNIDVELEKYFSISVASGSLLVWIAEEEGRIVGTAGVCFFQYPPSYSNPTGKIAYVTNVYTKIEYRKQGIPYLNTHGLF